MANSLFSIKLEFPALFSEIEEKKESFEITGYFVSMTSLEEVFLNLLEEETHFGEGY